MGPNDVLKSIVVSLAALTAAATVALGWLTFAYREKVIKAERERFELKKMRAADNRVRIASFESHLEDHSEESTHGVAALRG